MNATRQIVESRWNRFIAEKEKADRIAEILRDPVFQEARELVMSQNVTETSLVGFRGAHSVEEELKQAGVRSVFVSGVAGAFASLEALSVGGDMEDKPVEDVDLPAFDYESQEEMLKNHE